MINLRRRLIVNIRLQTVNMLFKPQYLTRFIDGFAPAVLEHARNMAKGTLLIHGVIASRFYDRSITDCINRIQQHLEDPDFHQAVEPFHSDLYLRNSSATEQLDRFVARCFDYYFSRLPILLRVNRIIRHGSRRRLSEPEIEQIERGCFAQWGTHYREMMLEYDFSGDRVTSMSFTKWYAKRDRRDDHVYDPSWLVPTLSTLYPDALADSNVENITVHALESCFPMFWDHLQTRYGQSLSTYGMLGWFVGDRDTEELSADLQRTQPSSAPHPKAT